MNRKGYTLVELLATLVVLAIVVGISVVMVNGGFGNAKNKSEDVFISTLTDALEIYLDTDAKKLDGEEYIGIIEKTHGDIKLYHIGMISFNDVINSSMHPISKSDFVNPANKDASCDINDSKIDIYRDDDYVYYYSFEKDTLGDCLKTTGIVTDLPQYESVDSYIANSLEYKSGL